MSLTMSLWLNCLDFFGGHKSFLWGHWYPYFWLLVTFALGFKARVGSLIRAWRRRTCYMFHEIHLKLWTIDRSTLGKRNGQIYIGSMVIAWESVWDRFWNVTMYFNRMVPLQPECLVCLYSKDFLHKQNESNYVFSFKNKIRKEKVWD